MVLVVGAIAFLLTAIIAALRGIWPILGQSGKPWRPGLVRQWNAQLDEARLENGDRVAWNHYVRHRRRA